MISNKRRQTRMRSTIARTSRNGDQYLMRLPPGMRADLNKRADQSGRSVNTEIVMAIINHLKTPTRLDMIERRLDALESRNPVAARLKQLTGM
jgi:hypothetical protein